MKDHTKWLQKEWYAIFLLLGQQKPITCRYRDCCIPVSYCVSIYKIMHNQIMFVEWRAWSPSYKPWIALKSVGLLLTETWIMRSWIDIVSRPVTGHPEGKVSVCNAYRRLGPWLLLKSKRQPILLESHSCITWSGINTSHKCFTNDVQTPLTFWL